MKPIEPIECVGGAVVSLDGHNEKVEDGVPVSQMRVEQDGEIIEITLTRANIYEMLEAFETLKPEYKRYVVCREGVEDIPNRIIEIGGLQRLSDEDRVPIEPIPVTFNYNHAQRPIGYAFDFQREIISDKLAEVSFLVEWADSDFEQLVEQLDFQPGIYATHVVEKKIKPKKDGDEVYFLVTSATIRSISFFPAAENPSRAEAYKRAEV